MRHKQFPRQVPRVQPTCQMQKNWSVAFQPMLNSLLVDKTQSLESSPGWCCSGGRGAMTGSGGIAGAPSSINGLSSLLPIAVKLIRSELVNGKLWIQTILTDKNVLTMTAKLRSNVKEQDSAG